MGELESIEKLVEKYKLRIEQIFGKEIGDFKVKKCFPLLARLSGDPPMMVICNTIYVNLKSLNRAKQMYSTEIENAYSLHELVHILDNNHSLSDNILNHEIGEHMAEGFAEFVAFEFPEIYQNEKVTERIKEDREKEIEKLELGAPYIFGYEFFKKVGEAIGRENILKVFENPPQTMKEVREPERYLERIKGGRK